MYTFDQVYSCDREFESQATESWVLKLNFVIQWLRHSFLHCIFEKPNVNGSQNITENMYSYTLSTTFDLKDIGSLIEEAALALVNITIRVPSSVLQHY